MLSDDQENSEHFRFQNVKSEEVKMNPEDRALDDALARTPSEFPISSGVAADASIDFDSLQAGAELDALIAEKVMGMVNGTGVGDICGHHHGSPIIRISDPNVAFKAVEFNPSTKIEDAWMVVEKMRERALMRTWT